MMNGRQAMKQVHGIRNKTAHMKVTHRRWRWCHLLAHEGDMRWNSNEDGIDFNP